MGKKVEHKPTQNERILDYLRKKGSITQREAEDFLGVMRLASRISDMRSRGVPIIDEWVKVTNRWGEKCRIKRYRLGVEDNGGKANVHAENN